MVTVCVLLRKRAIVLMIRKRGIARLWQMAWGIPMVGIWTLKWQNVLQFFYGPSITHKDGQFAKISSDLIIKILPVTGGWPSSE